MLVVIVGLILLSRASAMFYKTNITDFSTCTEYYSRHGSVYKDFFAFSDTPSLNESLSIDFHFSVLTASDAHILLSPSITVEKDDPVYEVVIGAGGNTFCDIRRKVKATVKASIRLKGLLSSVDFRSFWLHITKDGVIEVGREGEELAFLSWEDPDPLPLKVFSFSTWRGVEAKWYFDCKRDEHTKKIERNLTYTEKLRRDLLSHYDPYVRPVKNILTPTTVRFSLVTYRFSLDELKSIIEINGMTKLEWHDEKMQWNSTDYGNMETVHIFRREIWQPSLMLFNAVDDGRDILKDSMMVAHSNGLIEWNPAIYLKAWCDARDKGDWPRDVHECSLVLGFWLDQKNSILQFNQNDSQVIYVYQQNTEWQLLSVNISTEELVPTLCAINVKIRRASNIYHTIFLAPFAVVAASLLSTFWMSPFSQLKISLAGLQMVLSTMVLIGLALFIPTHPKYTPYLISLYSYSLVAGLVATIIAIIVINISRNQQKYSLSHFMSSILTAAPIKLMLCLPDFEMSEEYGKLSEAGSSKLHDGQQTWILLGAAIDRLAFFIYLPLTIYAIYLNYKQT